MVPMDRARQDWVHEHAETGRPSAARYIAWIARRIRERDSCYSPARGYFARAAGRTAPPESPARTATNSLQSDRHNQQPVRLVFIDIRIGSPPLEGISQTEAIPRASPRLSAHPFLRRSCASPSDLAACTGSHRLPDGKVRWQKRFVFPARRMRRGLRF